MLPMLCEKSEQAPDNIQGAELKSITSCNVMHPFNLNAESGEGTWLL